MPQFILKINLGNDAMQNGADIARALRKVSFDIDWRGIITRTQEYPVKDTNGNTIGNWFVKADDKDNQEPIMECE